MDRWIEGRTNPHIELLGRIYKESSNHVERDASRPQLFMQTLQIVWRPRFKPEIHLASLHGTLKHKFGGFEGSRHLRT